MKFIIIKQISKSKYLMLNSLPDVRGDSAMVATPTNISATIYVADLPRTTSYLDLSDFFEKHGGPCNIIMKR